MSYAFPSWRLAPIDPDWGRDSTLAILGGGTGIVLATLVILLRSARDPKGELPASFTTMNGIGSLLIGRRDRGSDGSYVTTEWFVIGFVPVFPICSYRVRDAGLDQYHILSKSPTIAADYLRGYGRSIAVIAAFAAVMGSLVWYIKH